MSATGLYRAIRIGWTNPANSDLHSMEVWASQTNNRATATRVAAPRAAQGTQQAWVHSILTPGAVWYYWIRSVDTSANVSTTYLPVSATGGWTATVSSIPSGDLPAATEAAAGAAELATQAETDAGTDDARIVTPLKLTNATTVVHPARTISTNTPLTGGGDLSANRILDISLATESADGSIELATQAEVNTGTDAVRAVVPATLGSATTVGHVRTVEKDFGASLTMYGSWTVSDTLVVSTSRIIPVLVATAPVALRDGVAADGDEADMEPMAVWAESVTAGSFTLVAEVRDGPVDGPYVFLYTLQ